MYVCRCAHPMACVWRSEENLLESVLSSTMWVLGSDSGCHAWWQVPLPAESSHQAQTTTTVFGVKKSREADTHLNVNS